MLLLPNPFIWRITKVWLDIRVEGGGGKKEAEQGSRMTIQKYHNTLTQHCNVCSGHDLIAYTVDYVGIITYLVFFLFFMPLGLKR